MKKIIIIIGLLFMVLSSYSQTPYASYKYTITMGDSITPKFKPNFLVQYWIVSIKDTGNGLPATHIDSIAVWGENHNGDTVLLGMRRVNKDTVTNVITYDYAVLPSGKLPYQDFWVNDPTGIVAIWCERLNKNYLSGRKTWLDFEAVRKIY